MSRLPPVSFYRYTRTCSQASPAVTVSQLCRGPPALSPHSVSKTAPLSSRSCCSLFLVQVQVHVWLFLKYSSPRSLTRPGMGGGDRAFQSRLSLSNHTSVSQSVSQSVSFPGPTATTRLSTSNCHLSPEILHDLLHEKRAFKSQVKSSHFINNRQPNRKPIECVLSCLEASSGGCRATS